MVLTKLKFVTGGVLVIGLLRAGADISPRIVQAGPIRSDPMVAPAAREDDSSKDTRNSAHGPADREVQKLLRDRLATLRQFATAVEQDYRAGKASIAEVNDAQTRLLKAELELCESDEDRLPVYERAANLATDYKKIAEQLFRAGEAPHAAVLAAKAGRLDAEIALERARAQVAARPTGHKPRELKIPESLRLRHAAFQAEFLNATKDAGQVGEAAQAIEALANAHFAKAKDAFPPLGLLPLLAEGRDTSEMAEARRMAEQLRTQLPQIRREHRTLLAGLQRLAEAARAEGKLDVVRFAERLRLHILEEEEVLYPAVLLVGEHLKARSAKE